tara:strand:+ start:1276 stop:1758 length:483 start_codon:yes stop_codon:yes gene_type:complete
MVWYSQLLQLHWSTIFLTIEGDPYPRTHPSRSHPTQLPFNKSLNAPEIVSGVNTFHFSTNCNPNPNPNPNQNLRTPTGLSKKMDTSARIRALRQSGIVTLMRMNHALETLGETDDPDQYKAWERVLMGANAEHAAKVFDEAFVPVPIPVHRQPATREGSA